MNPIIIVVIVLVVVIAGWAVTTYNALVKLRNKCDTQWAQINVQLKRRADLIPNLIETVKGYAAHEKETLNAVIEARSKYMKATTAEAQMEAGNGLTSALNRLFALSEGYPELKANANFLQLQNDLKDTEDKIAYARQFYNDDVNQYKNKIEMFPSSIIASFGGFGPKPFYDVAPEDMTVPKVNF
ncbi:MAG: LemA family protein [Erysipelotrichaceae bacterium]|nr:LemA family protein [Erysipelotrichaceae bacterium]